MATLVRQVVEPYHRPIRRAVSLRPTLRRLPCTQILNSTSPPPRSPTPQSQTPFRRPPFLLPRSTIQLRYLQPPSASPTRINLQRPAEYRLLPGRSVLAPCRK